MNLKKLAVISLATAILPLSAQATNFSYSEIGISVDNTEVDEASIDPILGNDFERFNSFGIHGSLQTTKNSVLGIDIQGAQEKNKGNDVTLINVYAGAKFPFSMASTLDIAPRIGIHHSENELCLGSICEDINDTGLFYGLEARSWIVPQQVEVFGHHTRSTIVEGSAVGFGFAFWPSKGQRFSVEYINEESIERVKGKISFVF